MLIGSSHVNAQAVPGAADAGRINLFPEQPKAIDDSEDVIKIQKSLLVKAPDGADKINVKIGSIRVKGVSVFDDQEIAAIVTPHFGTDMTLDQVWDIAQDITDLYRSAGFFLTRAYVPVQEINQDESVELTIKVVEGYISNVYFENEGLGDDFLNNAITKEIERALVQRKAVRIKDLESILLRINDLPGTDMHAVLEPAGKKEDYGAVAIRFVPKEYKKQTELLVDNYGSKFLGAHQVGVRHVGKILPLQETSVFASSSVPPEELVYGGVHHTIPFTLDWKLDIKAELISSNPGHTLETLNVESKSLGVDLGLTHQIIRQRQEVLQTTFGLAAKNTDTDISNVSLFRDRVRYAYWKLRYDTDDMWDGYNQIIMMAKKGLGLAGASNKGDLDNSRTQADSDFLSLNITYDRQEMIERNILMTTSVAGQYASGPLFSSQEIGYGGQKFGRAYNSSEIIGDHGLMAKSEFRYRGLDAGEAWGVDPYLFVDAGIIWNDDDAQLSREFAGSYGFGFYADYKDKVLIDAGLAMPISREIDTPLYGGEDMLRLYAGARVKF